MERDNRGRFVKGHKGYKYWLGKSLNKGIKEKISKTKIENHDESWNKGKSWPEEIKSQISLKNKGKHFSSKTEFKKGLIPWNKGLTKETDERVKEISEKLLGKEFTGERKLNLSKSHMGQIGYWEGKKRPNLNLGKTHTKETKEKISENRTGKCTGEKHHNWLGGISFEPYGIEFNKKLKEQIRARDNHTCQECKHTQNQLGYKLIVHHIDYNKKNNKESNLISLCRSCHCQTNFKRENWTDYFQNKLVEVI